MTRVLVDSHAFLWAVLEDHRLSQWARSTWLDQSAELLISPASLWEIAIKVGVQKLKVDRPLPQFFAEELAANNLMRLPISADHAAFVATLPAVHRDPFDRLLIAQALCEGLPILSADRQLDAYGASRVW